MTRHKILLADDSVTIRKVVELTFADEGIDVVSVPDGDAAMLKFVEINPDLVIADVNMPGMTGYHLCEMIKQDETTNHIPVILLVGSFEPFDPVEAVRVGSNYYFTKPFQSIRDLVSKVKEYLDLMSVDDRPPEMTDIEELYNRSIVETPEVEPGEEFAMTQPVITEEPQIEFAQEQVEETPAMPAETVEPDVDATVELGDTGMDDEIIETSHPGEPVDAGIREPVIDPFASHAEQRVSAVDEPVMQIERGGYTAETAGDETAPEPSVEPLRFEIDESEAAPESEAAVEEVHFAPRDEAAAGPRVTPETASPELIELLVNRVIDRLSDTAIRAAAQDAVPRIAEKLIREALEEEGRK